MIKSGIGMLAATLGVVVAATAWGHEHHDHSKVTGVVRERMDAMVEMGRRMKAIDKRVRAKEMLASVADDARVVRDLAAGIVPLFPQGSSQSPTEASAAIWRNFADFESKAKALEGEAAKLAAIKPSDAQAMSRQAAAVMDACSSCHEKYRIKQ